MKHIILSLVCLLVMAASAQAGPAAFVQSITPEAWASGPDGRQDLAVGSQLQPQDSLHTNAGGRLSLRFSDGTELNMQGSTSLDIADYVFEENVNFALNISSGAATLVTGAIVQQNPEAFKITTPLGTVGVRGTTVFVSVTNDKVVIVVLDMEPGHSVVVTGPDGQQVVVSEPGQQVELIRGEATPTTSSPVSDENLAAIENPQDDTFSELPHRDTGEQTMLLMEQDMNAISIIIPVVDPPAPGPVPTPRMTYPAFLLGMASPVANIGSLPEGAMSADGGYVVMGLRNSATSNYDAYLWKASDGSLTLLASPAQGTGTGVDISSDGGRVMVYSGPALALNMVIDTATLTQIAYTLSADNGGGWLTGGAISGNGNSVFGYYSSTGFGNNNAMGRWVYNGASYVQVDLTDSGSNTFFEGYPYAASYNGSVVGGYSGSSGVSCATYWMETAVGSNHYTEYAINPLDSGAVNAISSDGQWLAGESYAAYYYSFRYNTVTQVQDRIEAPSPAYTDTFAAAVSDDGAVVGGYAIDSLVNDDHAFFWTPANGLVIVADHLSAYGVNTGSVNLSRVQAVSADGSILLCVDRATNAYYLARIDGDYLGLTTPSNIYASIGSVAAGSSASVVSTLPIASLSNTSGFSMGTIPAAGETDTSGGSVLRVWGSGTFASDYGFNGDDKGAYGAVGATYFMDNGFSLGGGVFYGYRDVDSLWGSRQENESISLGLYGGYAPERTGLRLSLGFMAQSYDLETRRNYPNGADIDTSTGKGSGWGIGVTGHAGWVFGLSENVTLQPFAEYTFQRLATPDYEESGGAFPVSYDRHYFNQNITRVGADLQWDILPTLNLQTWLAWNHRFEDEGPASSGNIIGWDNFYFPGARLKQDWGDTGIGLRWRVYDNTTLGMRLGFGIDNRDSGLADMMGSFTVSIDL